MRAVAFEIENLLAKPAGFLASKLCFLRSTEAWFLRQRLAVVVQVVAQRHFLACFGRCECVGPCRIADIAADLARISDKRHGAHAIVRHDLAFGDLVDTPIYVHEHFPELLPLGFGKSIPLCLYDFLPVLLCDFHPFPVRFFEACPQHNGGQDQDEHQHPIHCRGRRIPLSLRRPDGVRGHRPHAVGPFLFHDPVTGWGRSWRSSIPVLTVLSTRVSGPNPPPFGRPTPTRTVHRRSRGTPRVGWNPSNGGVDQSRGQKPPSWYT